MGKVIAFSGKAGSGKTAAAKILMDKLGHGDSQIVSFAFTLKRKALEDFGDYLTHDDLIRNKTKVIEISGRTTTIRQLLIDIGMMYRNLDHNFWVRQGTKQAQAAADRGITVLIDDMRFPNEYKTLREMGATLIRIERPNISLIDDESEKALDDHEFDAKILNDGNLEDLARALDWALTAA